ncbi:hypothetical protein M405DRAFT_761013 [Rhizopogon salebrosus TDB-379]|nr:hypothetical protein M405DRAFT_761013 [Rhizopogon salebrosus TDB-379]
MNENSVFFYPLLAREVNYHIVSSFTFLLWDIVITSKSEIEHIWSKPWNSFFKWLYFYLRYFGLAVQIFHLFAAPYLNSGNASKSTCFIWYVYTAALAQLHTTAIEIILATRVYALFNRSRRIAIILGLLMLLEYIMFAVVVGKYFPGIVMMPYCILSKPPFEIVYHTIVILTTQTTLLGLTLMKHILAKRAGWGRTPLVSLLIRDGTTAHFIICVIFFSIASFCELHDERSVIIFFWLISIVSSCGYRLIINVQRLTDDGKTHSVPHPRITSQNPHITSQIEIEFPSRTTMQSI